MKKYKVLLEPKICRKMSPPSSEWKESAKCLVFRRSVLQLLDNTNDFPRSLILFTLMMEAILSSETSVLIRVIRRQSQEDGFLHSHRGENLKSYKALTGWALWYRSILYPVK
jgi:hypothetical protein